MATHLLIPISDIEDQVEAFKQFLQYNGEDSISLKENYIAQGCLNVYEKLLSTTKQISLSEDDIEERAEEFWQKSKSGTFLANHAPLKYIYKQALKDLLK